MKIRPLGDRVVIKPLEKEEKTAGGIVLPDTAKEKQIRGKIVAVGPGRRLEDGSRAGVDLKVGDEVVFQKYAGTEIRIDGVDYTIMRTDDVLAKVEAGESAKSEGKESASKGKKSRKK